MSPWLFVQNVIKFQNTTIQICLRGSIVDSLLRRLIWYWLIDHLVFHIMSTVFHPYHGSVFIHTYIFVNVLEKRQITKYMSKIYYTKYSDNGSFYKIHFFFIYSRKPIYIHAFLWTKCVIKPTSSFKNNKYLSVIDIGEVTRDFFTTPWDCTVSFKIWLAFYQVTSQLLTFSRCYFCNHKYFWQLSIFLSFMYTAL